MKVLGTLDLQELLDPLEVLDLLERLEVLEGSDILEILYLLNSVFGTHMRHISLHEFGYVRVLFFPFSSHFHEVLDFRLFELLLFHGTVSFFHDVTMLLCWSCA